jgi:hypothetical protein
MGNLGTAAISALVNIAHFRKVKGMDGLHLERRCPSKE